MAALGPQFIELGVLTAAAAAAVGLLYLVTWLRRRPGPARHRAQGSRYSSRRGPRTAHRRRSAV